ncbi:hypothetical protein VKT23_010291 [Stygiomarasmius scandens]|uniref:Uncharacterized protein n=1 Tax=Marasmiellus scandens TaxID=2682957 RepID=A0ABR1JDY5_9AGAR
MALEHLQMELHSILETLVSQCHRWRHVTWAPLHATGRFTSPLEVKRALPLLKSLELRGPVTSAAQSPVGIFAAEAGLEPTQLPPYSRLEDWLRHTWTGCETLSRPSVSDSRAIMWTAKE